MEQSVSLVLGKGTAVEKINRVGLAYDYEAMSSIHSLFRAHLPVGPAARSADEATLRTELYTLQTQAQRDRNGYWLALSRADQA